MQTVSTVGYGDFTVNTLSEYIFAIIWMVAGTNVYAFVIGVMSSWVATSDRKEAVFDIKMRTIEKYFTVHNIPKNI